MDTFTGMMKMIIIITGPAVSYQTAVMTETQKSITAAGMMGTLLGPFIFPLTLLSSCSSLVTMNVRVSMVPGSEKSTFTGTAKIIHRRPRQLGATPFWSSWAREI